MQMNFFLQQIYRKQQKLSGGKVSQFNGFYHNVGKTYIVRQVYISTQNGTYKLVGKTFVVHQKSAKTAKAFSRLTFVVYSI